MREFEISGAVATEDIESIIDNACDAPGLRQIAKTTLTYLSGYTHWRYKQGGGVGIPEISWWPREGRVLLYMHDNRVADWIEQMSALKAEIEDHLPEGIIA